MANRAKTIKIEIDAEGIQEIYSEWLGQHISMAKAERVLGIIKKEVEEELRGEVFRLIAHIIDRE